MPSTYEPIATTTLGSAVSSVSFSSISSAFTDLRLVMSVTTSASDWSFLRFNGDTGSSTLYSATRLYAQGSTPGSARLSNYDKLQLGDGLYGIGTSTTIPTFITLDIFSYTGSTFKSSLTTISGDQNGSGYIYRNVNLYSSTSAISSMLIANASGSNFLTGSTFTLYGIKNA